MVGENHYSYAHEINTLLDKPILLCIKAELTTIQRKLNSISFLICSNGTIILETIIEIDANQLYSYSMCLKACIRDGTTMKKHKSLKQGNTKFVRLEIWSCHIFEQPGQKLKLRATALQEDRKKRLLQR